MKRLWILLVSAACVLPPLSGAAQAGVPEESEIRLGSVAMDIPAEMYRRLAPLTKYLSATLKRPVTLKLSANMSAAIEEVSNGSVELAYLTPVAYIKAHAKGNVQLVAKTLTNKKASFQLMVVVRDDSPIKRIQDLKGKTFAFGDKAAILQRAVVVGAGMPLENLGEYKFIGHYDNIAKGVANGDFDAGILKDTTASDWKNRGLRILHGSPPLPPYNIVASSKVDAKLLKQMRQAFLALDTKNPAHKKVIQALDDEYDGFAPARDSDYDVVRRLIAPFEEKK
ncbi:MAG: phosphate/phosphite/phosphonate ABC transporter substrate-binding protein [Pseudomonadota bacterium]